jgi:hypothetical protein
MSVKADMLVARYRLKAPEDWSSPKPFGLSLIRQTGSALLTDYYFTDY